jgi:hypothetical protein
MNCDDVFEILTRGPFPTGAASDHLVEQHLDRCSSCQRLAEALRPAIELFEEACLPEESQGLPRYIGPWASGGEQPRLPAPQRNSPRARPAEHRRSSPACRGLPVDSLRLAIGGLVGAAAWEDSRADLAGVAGSLPIRTVALSREAAASLNLASPCWPVVAADYGSAAPRPAAALPDQSHDVLVACCTQCHAAQRPAAAARQAISLIASNCHVCH